MTKSKMHSKIGVTLVLFAAGILRASGADTFQRSVKTDAELFAALDNSIWIADGKVPSTVTPACPASSGAS